MILISTHLQLSAQYKGMFAYFSPNIIQEFTMDEEGNISFSKIFNLNGEPRAISISPDIKIALVPAGGMLMEIFTIDKERNLYYKGLHEYDTFWENPPIFSFDSKYMNTMFFREEIQRWTITLFRREGEYNFINTNKYIDLPGNSWTVNTLAISKYFGTFLGFNHHEDDAEMLVFKFDELAENIYFTGQKIQTKPFEQDRDLTISSNGRYCCAIGFGIGHNDAIMLTINPDGTVNEDFKFVIPQDINLESCIFSPDSKYLYITSQGGYGTLSSYEINYDGTTTFIQVDKQYSLAQAFDITPDGKFGVISHHYSGDDGTQIVSVIKFHSDGTFEKLDKDFKMTGFFSYIKFIPPYVTSADDEIWEMYE